MIIRRAGISGIDVASLWVNNRYEKRRWIK
jgi:hypothetical protein